MTGNCLAFCLLCLRIVSLTDEIDERTQIVDGRVGRWFFEQAIARSRELGATLVQLTSDKKRADAIRFYESLGFVASHEGMKLQLS